MSLLVTPAELDQRSVVSYLLDVGLLSPATVVDEHVDVVDVSRRNRNFLVLTGAGSGFMVKQGLGPERAAGVAHEAAVYERLHSGNPHLARHLPALCHFDAPSGTLVLEVRPGAKSLRDYYVSRGQFSRTLAARLGDALGALHRHGGGPETGGLPWQRSSPGPPWVLSLHHCDVHAFGEFSSGNLGLIRILQRFPAFCAHLDALCVAWRARSFVHNDVRWDNCVVASRSPSGRTTELYLVDWELSGPGEPAWDVGSVFAGYLSLWLLSIPVVPGAGPERLTHLARWPLDGMHPAIRSFWRNYVERVDLDPGEADDRLAECVRYAAARLLQIAVEQTQTVAEPSAGAILALQVSHNALDRPLEAAETLLGLRPTARSAA